MLRKSTIVIVMLLVLAISSCQPTEPESAAPEQADPVEVTRIVEVNEVVEVTRLVEVPTANGAAEIVEVTRIVEVPVENDAPDALPIMAGLTVDVQTYDSAMTGRNYVVYVALPFGYEMSEDTYTAMYVTDGDWYTIPTALAASQLNFGAEMPPVITVGIGYGGTMMDGLERREQDMQPEGSADFLRFLQEELIPDIEANYRVDTSVRTLVGHSLGGQFSLYALFNAPETFGRIVASSPSCLDMCGEMEGAYAADHDTLPVRLYLTMGDMDEYYMPGYNAIHDALEASDYAELTSVVTLLEGETHLSVRARAIASGIRWVYTATE